MELHVDGVVHEEVLSSDSVVSVVVDKSDGSSDSESSDDTEVLS